MSVKLRIGLWLAVLALVPTAAAGAQPQGQSDIVVRGSVARAEIERVLEADNVDTVKLSTMAVWQIISAIPRGRAPEDFWRAYQAHVGAWEERAALEQQGAAAPLEELIAAERRINRTFDEVERIARRYGANMPAPPVDTSTIS
jgi:hypothetical protein